MTAAGRPAPGPAGPVTPHPPTLLRIAGPSLSRRERGRDLAPQAHPSLSPVFDAPQGVELWRDAPRPDACASAPARRPVKAGAERASCAAGRLDAIEHGGTLTSVKLPHKLLTVSVIRLPTKTSFRPLQRVFFSVSM